MQFSPLKPILPFILTSREELVKEKNMAGRWGQNGILDIKQRIGRNILGFRTADFNDSEEN